MWYVVLTFVVGLILAFAYVIGRDRKNGYYAFVVVSTIHALWNTFAAIEEFWFS